MGPTFFRFQNFGRQAPSSPWWLVMIPGLMLISFGAAILIWPQLLAYMVAFLILSLGITVTGWGWRLRQLEHRQRKNPGAQSKAHGENSNVAGVFSPSSDGPRASTTTIHYDHQE